MNSFILVMVTCSSTWPCTGHGDWDPSMQPVTDKTLTFITCVVCFPCFELSHRPLKKGNWKMADLKAKWHFSHLCDALAVQAQWNCFIVLSYLPTQCQNRSSGSLSIPTFEIYRYVGWPCTQKDPSKNRIRCLELCDVAGASSNSGPHERLLQKNLSFLNLMFSRLLRIIVDIITRCILYLSWVLDSILKI